MSRLLIYAIVFIEGFCSLGAEVIALRRLVPHVGSSIIITAPTIGFFLLALALGYASGARVAADYKRIVARNFLISAALAGLGLAGLSVDWMFAHLQPVLVAYLFFIGGVLCPLAWLLGQTVPILTNLMQAERTGEASGMALYWSTLGSFLGSLTLSLIVMQWLSVSAAVFACTLGLVIGALLLAGRNLKFALLAFTIVAVAAGFNGQHTVTADTAYAEYIVGPAELAGQKDPRAFMVNKSLASLIDDSEPPNYTRYIRHLRQILLDDLGFKGKEILVLGAGGFTLSHREPLNRYTYVDIDPAIRDIAEKHFLKEPSRGEFIVDDARRFIATSERRFDAVVVDVYSSHTSIPSHLVTREFWAGTRRVLKPEGVLLANLILDGKLETPYARNLLSTIESVFGRCAVDVLHKAKALANVEVSCFASSQPAASGIYVDEKNRADLDLARSR
ncbi:fused MFS/spermidine synthase [Ferribacterium limneticum]|uniref:fused MFS/spermidine synthase n=1 Tax=Ferribacterium limneticum TaxID=76259 RepID=UPI001CFBCF12|nr:fused MFS/spermidine synthase [Ferribacterium limneticum]UCV29694.1 fused MFS/spermidine synthase [Ferribacterium limneticum]UCV33613.1 fused MFS/spermidine synthase [Ferribacterium limneticum]